MYYLHPFSEQLDVYLKKFDTTFSSTQNHAFLHRALSCERPINCRCFYFRYVMAKLGSTKIDLNQLLDEVDKNKDGVIDYEGRLNCLNIFEISNS